VYVVRCKRTVRRRSSTAANEHEPAAARARRLGVTSVLETHGHWDHIGASNRSARRGSTCGCETKTPACCRVTTTCSMTTPVHQVGDLRLRTLHTPGHTPRQYLFLRSKRAPWLFTGDTLFPGGPGNTNHDAQDFATIITRSTNASSASLATNVTIWPGHGGESTIAPSVPTSMSGSNGAGNNWCFDRIGR